MGAWWTTTVDYVPSLFAEQIDELIAHLAEEDDASPLFANAAADRRSSLDVMGHSMGGGVASWYAANNPEKIRNLVLVAPAGSPVEMPFLGKLIRVPYLGASLLWLAGARMMKDKLVREQGAGDFAHPEQHPKLVAGIIERMLWCVDRPHWVSSFHNALTRFPLSDLQAEYQAIGAADIPTLVIWGTHDPIIPCENLDLYLKPAIPNLVPFVVQGAAHSPYLEQEDLCLQAVFDFLTASPS